MWWLLTIFIHDNVKTLRTLRSFTMSQHITPGLPSKLLCFNILSSIGWISYHIIVIIKRHIHTEIELKIELTWSPFLSNAWLLYAKSFSRFIKFHQYDKIFSIWKQNCVNEFLNLWVTTKVLVNAQTYSFFTNTLFKIKQYTFRNIKFNAVYTTRKS